MHFLFHFFGCRILRTITCNFLFFLEALPNDGCLECPHTLVLEASPILMAVWNVPVCIHIFGSTPHRHGCLGCPCIIFILTSFTIIFTHTHTHTHYTIVMAFIEFHFTVVQLLPFSSFTRIGMAIIGLVNILYNLLLFQIVVLRTDLSLLLIRL